MVEDYKKEAQDKLAMEQASEEANLMLLTDKSETLKT